MKLNNKGMAISGILYSILVLFLVLLFGILALLASGKYTFDKLKTDITSKLSNNVEKVTITDTTCFQFDYNTQTITKYNFAFSQCGTNVVVPESINNVIVKYIAAGAFFGGNETSEDKLISVDLTKAIYLKQIQGNGTIAGGAFSQNNIANLVIPDNVTVIGAWAFDSNSMQTLTLGNGVSYIGEGAFATNSLTSLSLPDTLTDLSKQAFYNNNISNLYLGNKLASIGDGTFQHNALTSLNIPASVKTIAANSFAENTTLTVINIDSLSGGVANSPWGATNATVNWKTP